MSMASARFVPPETTLEAFIEEQTNKNALSKRERCLLTQRIYENERKRRRIRKFQFNWILEFSLFRKHGL